MTLEYLGGPLDGETVVLKKFTKAVDVVMPRVFGRIAPVSFLGISEYQPVPTGWYRLGLSRHRGNALIWMGER